MKPRSHRRGRFSRVLAFLALAVSLPASFAHEGLEEAIEIVTAQIEAAPGKAWLYFQRGELHRAHRDWLPAAADYDRAETLDPQLAIVDLGRGEMLRAQRQHTAAREALERFVARAPADPHGYAARARVWSDLGQPQSAAEDYARAIERSARPLPELYLAWSGALTAAGRNSEALGAVNAGITKLGPAVTLVLAAIDLEVALGRTGDALARLDAFMATQARKERWLLKRGQILENAGRRPEAAHAYNAARAALRALPHERRMTKQMLKHAGELEAAVKRIEGPGGLKQP